MKRLSSEQRICVIAVVAACKRASTSTQIVNFKLFTKCKCNVLPFLPSAKLSLAKRAQFCINDLAYVQMVDVR